MYVCLDLKKERNFLLEQNYSELPTQEFIFFLHIES